MGGIKVSLSEITGLEEYEDLFVESIPQTPTGRYASLIILRETKSYAIFTTEGGEQQDVERTPAGLQGGKAIDRLVMFKRKQVAVERRTGKALLRQYGIFPYAIVSNDDEVTDVLYGEKALEQNAIEDCYLTEGLCTHCPDCLIYGYAAIEGEGARKSRVLTDSCFSVRPYPLIQRLKKFNVIDEKKQTSGTITDYDYSLPGIVLPSVVTTVDLTLDEFAYVIGNVLRTRRYGKEVTRQGTVRNHIVGIAFSDVELFANLEFSQAFYDALTDDDEIELMEQDLTVADFRKHLQPVMARLTADVAGRLTLVTGQELEDILDQVRDLNRDETRLAAFLRALNVSSASFTV